MSDDDRSTLLRRQLELRKEQLRRRCRQSFISFAIEALAPRHEIPALHHRLIASELEALARGKFDRLMILAPPGSAKTTYTSRLLPAWFYAFNPGANIIAASHTASLALENSGHVQAIVRDNADMLGYGLRNDARDLWHPTTGGGYLATGVGGTIRGFRADLAIIDDPIKSYEEAESLTLRDSTWSWFSLDLQSRLTPTGRIVLIATPLHEDDLMGRLLRTQQDQWKVLRLPAISEGDGDALNRPEGKPLWTDGNYGYGAKLLELREQHEREGRMRDWFGQYQGRPRPPEGAMFKPDAMPIIEPNMIPNIIEHVRAWDLAASVKGDFTVGLLLGRAYDQAYENRFVVLDVVRFRGPPEEVRRTVKAVAEADPPLTKIWLPRDPAQAGVDQADSYIRMLSGYRVEAERMSGSKVTRADAAASQLNIGRIGIVRAPWNAAFIEELASFPSGLHDDCVDSLALAFSKLEKADLSVWLRL